MAMNRKEKAIMAELLDGIMNHRFDNKNPYSCEEVKDGLSLLNGMDGTAEWDWASDTWQKYLPKVRGEERRAIRYEAERVKRNAARAT